MAVVHAAAPSPWLTILSWLPCASITHAPSLPACRGGQPERGHQAAAAVPGAGCRRLCDSHPSAGERAVALPGAGCRGCACCRQGTRGKSEQAHVTPAASPPASGMASLLTSACSCPPTQLHPTPTPPNPVLSQMQVSLTTSDWDECSAWLTALKRLIKARHQMLGQ